MGGTGSSRLLLTLSGGILFVVGTILLFAPVEVSKLIDERPSKILPLAIQLLASGLLSFAILDWMSRGQRIGGIYGRPLGMANLLLFTTLSLTLCRAILHDDLPIAIAPLIVPIGLLAAAFAWIMFRGEPAL